MDFVGRFLSMAGRGEAFLQKDAKGQGCLILIYDGHGEELARPMQAALWLGEVRSSPVIPFQDKRERLNAPNDTFKHYQGYV